MIQVQRIYEFENKSSQENNSIRILVDRLWPRGIFPMENEMENRNIPLKCLMYCKKIK